MKKQKIDWKIVCSAIFCLTAVEIYALSQGINGVYLTMFVAVVAGLAGYKLKK